MNDRNLFSQCQSCSASVGDRLRHPANPLSRYNPDAVLCGEFNPTAPNDPEDPSGATEATVACAPIPRNNLAPRIALVDQHIRFENEHNLEGVLSTFGDTAQYDDEPWGEHYEGRNGVRLFYQQLMNALPDLKIEVQRQHVTDDAIVVEVMIRGTHLGSWRGLPATGRRVDLPLCGVYTFDAHDQLAGEKIYYDRGTVLRQLGVFHEPQSLLGEITIVATHPLTLARALGRKLLRR